MGTENIFVSTSIKKLITKKAAFTPSWVTRAIVESPRLLGLLCFKPLWQLHHCSVTCLPVFIFLIFFVCFENWQIEPTKLKQRQEQDFLWHHQELPPLSAKDAHPTEARSHCGARYPRFTYSMQGVSISPPPECHMAMTVWVMWWFFCLFWANFSTNRTQYNLIQHYRP